MSQKLVFLDMDGVLVDLPQDNKHLPIGNRLEWDDAIFWGNLPKLPWADQLVDFCFSNFDETYILSRPCGAPSVIGKHSWMEKHYPILKKNVILTRSKHLLAKAGRVLIDDDCDQCARFFEAGGHTVWIPNPRIHLFEEMPTFTTILSTLQELLKRI